MGVPQIAGGTCVRGSWSDDFGDTVDEPESRNLFSRNAPMDLSSPHLPPAMECEVVVTVWSLCVLMYGRH